MSDRPIIFSSSMVRALLEGRKTQTRRLLKQPPPEATSAGTYWTSWEGATNRWTWLTGDPKDCDTWEPLNSFNAPYKVGDRLYVRENWREYSVMGTTMTYGIPVEMDADTIEFQADCKNAQLHKWRPSIHMPKALSRITLTIEAVKVERLQDISEDDAKAEGARPMDLATGREVLLDETLGSYRAHFKEIWQSLNAKRAPWDSNPWVVAVTFKVHKCNIDRMPDDL